MNEQINKSIPSAAAAASTEPEITILADDVASDRDKNLAASLGVQLPPAPIIGPVSEFIQEGSDEFGRKTSYIGEMTQKLLNKFLGKHKSEWESHIEAEREKKECAAKFRFYTETLAQLKQKADEFRGIVENAKGVDFPQTLYENVFKTGHRVEMLFSSPHSTQILAAFFLQQFGPAALIKIEDEIGEVNAQFRTFKQKKSGVLTALGLDGIPKPGGLRV